MKENPYSTLIQLMQEHGAKHNPPSIQVGEIVSPPPNIIIKIGELQIDKDNILIANNLTPTDALKTGNIVAVMPAEDRQMYIILAKLVKLNG